MATATATYNAVRKYFISNSRKERVMCGWSGIVQENRPSLFKRPACYPVVKARLLGAGRALLALKLLDALRYGGSVLQELLLDLRVLFKQRLGAEQQPLEDHCLEIVRLELERLVDGLFSRLGVFQPFVLRNGEVLLSLLPVVGGDHLMGLGVVRFLLGARLESLHRL